MAAKGLAARLAMFEQKEEEAKVFNAKNKVSGSSASKPIVLKERVDANANDNDTSSNSANAPSQDAQPAPYYQRMKEQQQKKEESSAQQQPTHDIEPAAALPLAQAQPISSKPPPSEPPPSQPQPQPISQASPITTTTTTTSTSTSPAKNGSNGSSNSLQSRIAMFGGLQTAQNIVAAPADPKTNALHEIEKMRKYEQETARKVEQDKLAQQQREEEAAKQADVQVANEAAEVERQRKEDLARQHALERQQREERERAAAKEREDQQRRGRERELQAQRERQELEKQQQQQEQRAKQEQEQRLQREQAEKEKEKEQDKAEQARLAAIQQQQQQQREQLEREQLQREQAEKEKEQAKEKAEQARLEQQQQQQQNEKQQERQEADRLRLEQQRHKSDEADKSRQQKLEDSLRRLEERKKQQSQPTIPATTSTTTMTNNIAPASNISTSTPATATAKVVLATAKQPFAPPIETTSDVDEDEPMKPKQKLKKQTTPMDVLVASGLFTDGDGGGVEPLHIQDDSDDEHVDKQQFKSKRRKSKSKESKHPKKQYPASTRVNKSMAWDETDDANNGKLGGKRVKTMKSQSDDIKDAFDDKHSTPDITLADARKLKMNQFHNDPAMRTKLKAMKNLSGGGFKIHVNYRYIIDDGRIGVCKFKGRTAFGKSSEDWIGIKVEHGQGVNNGTVSGKTYFRCRDGQGVMVKAERILIELGHETKVAIDAQTISKAKELSEAYALVQEEKLKERQRKQKKSKEWKTDDEYAGWLPPKWDDFEEDHADNLFGQKLHYSKTLLDKYKGQKVEKKKHHTEV